MKANKFFYLYYLVIILTPLIYLVRIFWGEKLENDIYFKQHGSQLLRSEALPSFIVVPILLIICAGLLLWTKKIKEKAYNIKSIKSGDYFGLTIITFFLIFFIYFDIKIIQLLIRLTYAFHT